MKKYVAIWGGMFFIVASVSLYLMMEAVSTNTSSRSPDILQSQEVDSKIQRIQTQIQRNQNTIKEIKDLVGQLSKGGDKDTLEKLQKVLSEADVDVKAVDLPKPVNADKGWLHGLIGDGSKKETVYQALRGEVTVAGEMCSLADEPNVDSDVKTLRLMDLLPFDNPDGGVWKQGWPITYPTNKWGGEKKLYVFVVPHSHNDPGWVKTFDDYYQGQVRQLLDNMINKLEEDPRRKFIETEISFFSTWWRDISQDTRKRVKRLVDKGQLEITTGGWVMTDEANTHYAAIVDQLIEGNQWVHNILGVEPKSGWAIDPFGHSPTMAYILKRAGLNNMLIQRVHYAVKKQLAKDKQLEFMWRQHWDQEGSTDMMCHLMPFYSYDVPHTCGPDPKICCQFDFARMSPSRYNCPWKIAPTAITSSNVAERAKTLVDQYRKKSELYRSDVVLIPLGDDFRYDKEDECERQFTNYQKLFDHMNSSPELGVQAQFGTLSDYFNKIYELGKVERGSRPPDFPVLAGDFFTYSDRDDHYWSGYYTSRPFYKSLDRIMEYHVRAAEVAFTLALSYSREAGVTNFPQQKLMEKLVGARRNLGLYQHHDGITGTANDFVVIDYGEREGVMDCKTIIVEAASFLMLENKKDYKYPKEPLFSLDEDRKSHDSLPERTVLDVTEVTSSVLFYNSLGHEREQVVAVYVTSPFIEVQTPGGTTVQAQVDPIWESPTIMVSKKFKVWFVVRVPALGIARYTLRKVQPEAIKMTSHASIGVMNVVITDPKETFPFTMTMEKPEDIMLENSNLKAHISGKTGFLQSVTTKSDDKTHEAEVAFLKYGTRGSKEKSGAYLFMPDGHGKPLNGVIPVMRVMRGSVVSEVTVYTRHVQHTLRVYNSPGTDGMVIDMSNLVDIRKEMNFELAVSIATDVDNTDREFYTDLNGFQMLKHKTYDKLPLQANVYPMPAMAYIEDDRTRFSVLSAQSLGVACHFKGDIVVMLDRRLNQDDNRGLGQGVRDNKLTPNRFYLLFENRKSPKPKDKMIGYPSLQAHVSYLHLTHPIFISPENPDAMTHRYLPSFSPLAEPLPCEVHLLNLRTLQNRDDDPTVRFKPRNEAGLLLHSLGHDCKFPNKGLLCHSNGGKPKDKMIGYPSLQAHVSYLHLTHPIFISPENPDAMTHRYLPSFSPLAEPLPCEVHLLNLRTLQNRDDDPTVRFKPRNEAGLLLHSLGHDCKFPNKGLLCHSNGGTPKDKMIGYPSLQAHVSYLHLTHPIFISPENPDAMTHRYLPSFSPLAEPLPCEVHLLNLRTLQNTHDDPTVRFKPRNEAGLLLHSLGHDCKFPNKGLLCHSNGGR
ncbi:Alpha-mannosidase 2x [Mizuhopecten yessoensis]|uniref:Alpha-mannosidase 2 n=1 Tax=Mizuhopecten yessoensis TaxID=6573 RepID=A0A210PRN0_MIZYE|nr:Alpha-mannosidase 2x [Mizuhopecten yessoensis]